MGVCQSAEVQQQTSRNKKIEKDIQSDARVAKQEAKLLLLGAGEAGKSTLLKQMQILRAGGFSDEEIQMRKGIVYSNIVVAIMTLLDGMERYQEKFEASSKSREHEETVRFHTKNSDMSEPFPPAVFLAMKSLWQTKEIQNTYKHATELQLDDSAGYFLDNLERINASDYEITNQDIVRTRIATTGVHQIQFEAENLTFKVFDVGGQRSERKKWINCFDDVDAVIYICSLSEYNQVLREDDSTNRMHEAIRLFGWICNHEAFYETSIILFLNKKDLLEKKIATSPLRNTFTDYTGDDTYGMAVAFIEGKYHGQNNNTERQIYTHQTCATDSQQIEVILSSVLDTIIRANMKKLGWV